ncbi:GTP pyrophosphokinase [Arthrobacter sp. Hiyo6]|nr:GTP pyrophosphokinase [Arthrobacter sp. Hiyo6]
METQEMTSQVAAAKAIATIAHRFQTDKIGVAYIEHPRRVAAIITEQNAGLPHIAAAWLHDVIEDCGVTAIDLIAAGISQEVVDAVVLLTRTETNKGDGYYLEIRKNSVALAVKLADIDDNGDPKRTALLTEEKRDRLAVKYAHALKLLTGALPGARANGPAPS